MRQRCIFCDKLLEEDPSDEHIIAKNIGGRLHSKNLICRGCNSEFGAKLDENLRSRFEIITFWLKFKEHKKKNKILNVELEEKEYSINNEGPRLKHPIFMNKNGKNIPLIFPTKEDGIKYYENRKKKNPSLNVKEKINSLKSNIKEGQFYFKKKIEKENKFTWSACGKIVYEFLCLIKKNYQPSNKKFIDFVMGKLNPEKFPLCISSLDFNPLKKSNNKSYHIIIVEGRENENVIIGYLELFDSLKMLMLIDEDYNGESFINGYYHDLMENNNHNYFDPLESIPVDKKTIEIMVKNHPNDSDLNRCNRESINTKYKARFYPFKNLAEKIRDEIDNEIDLTINQIKEIEEDICIKMRRWGLTLNFPDKINQLPYEMMLIQKIIYMLDFLRKSFFLFGMDTTIFKRIIALFIFKGEKYRY